MGAVKTVELGVIAVHRALAMEEERYIRVIVQVPPETRNSQHQGDTLRFNLGTRADSRASG